MSMSGKRLLFAIGLLIIWFGFITMGPTNVVSTVVFGLGGWFMGGLIYSFSEKVFPNE